MLTNILEIYLQDGKKKAQGIMSSQLDLNEIWTVFIYLVGEIAKYGWLCPAYPN